ncbi:MAG: cytochrome c biogenesis protein CcsA [Bacteroidales bacterium]|nr:cytochrome c biogenesis protein CcsA [Bacteroidales bacterium]
MSWHNFGLFALPAVLAWIGGAVCLVWAAWGDNHAARRPKAALLQRAGTLLYLGGLLALAVFIGGFWLNIERPPFRTMGETRLWYAFFLPLCGILVYKRYRYAFVPAFSALLATVFIAMNLFKPEIHDKTLMPALQSAWFSPHVIIYIFAYALLGVAFLLACYRLLRRRAATVETLAVEDNLTRIGWVCLSIGMFFGAIWAKQAWGHFWTWDPKETWAAATFLCYGLYLHLRIAFPKAETWAQAAQIAGFLLLQMCWYGLNFFPALGRSSLHIYN